LDALQNPNSLDINLYTNNTSAETEQRSFQAFSDPFLVSFPSSFAGTRCYTDAATLPDNLNSDTSQAGLGVFIVNTDENPTISIFVKALLEESSSVLMAESAALALATDLLNQIQCTRYTIFSDNQQLVNFLNQSDLSNPPDWRIKPHSQHAANLLAIFGTQVRRIKRTQNQMAVSLARQAFQATTSNQFQYEFSCSNSSHANDCPLLRAISTVTIASVCC